MRLQPDCQATPALGPMRSRAAIQARLEKHLAELQATLLADSQSDASIHRCRVLIKKLRAWLRLLRPVAAVPHGKSADRRLKCLAQALSGTRNHQVLKDTVRSLSAAADARETTAACRKLQRRLNATAPAHSALGSVAETLGKIHLPDATGLDRRALRTGLRASYAKARKLSRIALADTGDPEKLHRLRRWVKHLHYQLGLLYALKDTAIEQPALLKQLGTALGRIHDLHELMRMLRDEQIIDPADRNLQHSAELVVRLASAELCQLTPVVSANAQLLFAARPKQFMALLS